ncbi:MAG: hypothetical protein RR636_10495 [Clostridium sp.]|uniref:hypothetical protein n=1 Tax=Clostridium sp. TaxID=1506 RepID=UPI00304709F7
MGIYNVPSSEEMRAIKKYGKLFENVKISDPVLLGGTTYREVIFKKKVISKFKSKGTSYLYIDSNNTAVTNENTILRLGRIFFFMDAFLNDESDSIIKALQNDDDVEKNNDDLELMMTGFQLIERKNKKYTINAEEVENVKEILSKLLQLRAKTNEKLDIFLKLVAKEMSKKKYFDEDVIEACMPKYKDVMSCNYEKVQLINKGAESYNYIKKAAEKTRRNYSIRFVTAHTEALMRVHYMMGYFENLIRSYGSIVEMQYNQYMKAIENAGKVNAEYKASILRGRK